MDNVADDFLTGLKQLRRILFSGDWPLDTLAVRLLSGLVLIVASAASVAAPAVVDDAPAFAPIPAWVRQLAVPPLPPADDLPSQVLLIDQQVRLTPGKIEKFTEIAIRVQTVQGLAAGNIVLPWRPGIDQLTIHGLTIKRGSRVIDVLASGQKFTVLRRETDLEAAKLDGVLTATMQMDGVEIGDIIDLAATVSSSDPVFGRHVEQLSARSSTQPVERVHIGLEWPNDVPVKVRPLDDFPSAKEVRGANSTVYELSANRLQPLILPTGAPARFRLGRLIEASDYTSWGDVAARLKPLYDQASRIPASGALRNELNQIKARGAEPTGRAEAALALVQEKIRYVAMEMGAGGLVPADAETTWASRYGDCKAKTALLLGLLRELGISAEPVLVNMNTGDALPQHLPLISVFDHILVRAAINGKTYWLDGTRTGDSSLSQLRVPAYSWGLPVTGGAAGLVSMRPERLAEPDEEHSLTIDARQGVFAPAPAEAALILRGDGARLFNLALANLPPAARDEALRSYWKSKLDEVTPATLDAFYDQRTGVERLTLKGSAKLDWDNDYWFVPQSTLAFKADFDRQKGPAADAPFEVDFPAFSRSTVTVLVPPGISVYTHDGSPNTDQTLAGVEYYRRAAFEKGVFTLERSERSVLPEVSAAAARSAQSALRTLYDRDVYLDLGTYEGTDADLVELSKATPDSATAYFRRGLLFLDHSKFDEAIADFGHAHELEPKNVWALAERGMAYVWKKDFTHAESDLAAVAAFDPGNPVLLRAMAFMATAKGDLKGAIAGYSASLAKDGNNVFARTQLARLRHDAGDDAGALADSEVALKLNPSDVDLRLLRSNIFRGLGKRDSALAEAAAVSRENPKSAYAQVAAAQIVSAFGDSAAALVLFDKALAIGPEAYIYINRESIRSRRDTAARAADIDAALKLEPNDAPSLAAKGWLDLDLDHAADAVAHFGKALLQTPDDSQILLGRGVALAKVGKQALAEKDFASSATKVQTSREFNSLCWTKATRRVALQTALADCNRALEIAPDSPAAYNSRGLVHLQLGQFKEAIADYDKALAKLPTYPSSLFGRSLAQERMGDKARAAADRASAIKFDSKVSEQFEEYGFPAAGPTPPSD